MFRDVQSVACNHTQSQRWNYYYWFEQNCKIARGERNAQREGKDEKKRKKEGEDEDKARMQRRHENLLNADDEAWRSRLEKNMAKKQPEVEVKWERSKRKSRRL